MIKWAAAGVVALLLAAAFFLPEWLSSVHDGQLLDRAVIQTWSGEQEGFAESVQLSVAEKLLLMRSGSLTAMELSRDDVSGVYVNISGSVEPEIPFDRQEDAELRASPEEEMTAYEKELVQKWENRMEQVKQELRSLQANGGLPELWSADSDLSYAGYGELLYMDSDARLSFQVYRMILESESCSITVTVDVQSGRILAFSLRWGWEGKTPSWGHRGAAGFGSVWRNYWGMDAIGGGWDNDYNRGILERTSDGVYLNSDYNAVSQISFTYDGQSIGIPLECWVSGGRSCTVNWNCQGP